MMIYKKKRDGFCEIVADDFIVKRIIQALEDAMAVRKAGGCDNDHGRLADYVDIYADLHNAVPATVYGAWKMDYVRK